MTGTGKAPGRHVLVVERDMIVGLSLAVDLLDLGFRVSGPFISVDEVSDILREDPPDVAIVDVDLRDGSGLHVARALLALTIPFVMFSTDGHRHAAGEFGGVPWIDKPASTAQVLGRLDGPSASDPPLRAA